MNLVNTPKDYKDLLMRITENIPFWGDVRGVADWDGGGTYGRTRPSTHPTNHVRIPNIVRTTGYRHRTQGKNGLRIILWLTYEAYRL